MLEMFKDLFANNLDLIGTLFTFIVIAIILSKKKKDGVGEIWEGESRTVVIEEKELRCNHCDHNRFFKREGILATTWVMFFRMGFLNESARCFVCSKCRCVHWFVTEEDEQTKVD